MKKHTLEMDMQEFTAAFCALQEMSKIIRKQGDDETADALERTADKMAKRYAQNFKHAGFDEEEKGSMEQVLTGLAEGIISQVLRRENLS